MNQSSDTTGVSLSDLADFGKTSGVMNLLRFYLGNREDGEGIQIASRDAHFEVQVGSAGVTSVT